MSFLAKIRHRWLNLILHVSAFIGKKKRDLGIRHSFRSFFHVIALILAEVFLIVVSAPLYIFGWRDLGKIKESPEHRTRRAIVLMILVPLLILLTVKMVFSWALSVYMNPQKTFEIFTEDENAGKTDYVMAEIAFTGISPEMKVPSIEKMEIKDSAELEIKGSSAPNTVVVIYMVSENDMNAPVSVYVSTADGEGKWELKKSREAISLAAGRYGARALSYDGKNRQKSRLSEYTELVIHENFLEKVMRMSDIIFNFIVIGLVILGVSSVLLTNNSRK